MIIKVIKYVISGGIAAVVNLLSLYVFTEFLGIWYLYSSILAFLVAITFSFTLQKFWTFRDHNISKINLQAPQFLIVSVVNNVLINSLLLYIFVELFGLWYILAQIIAGLIVAIISYYIFSKFIFKPKDISDKEHILITTGIYPPDIGGPSLYAERLYSEFKKMNYDTKVLTFNLEKKLPTGIRHLYFLIKCIPGVIKADRVLVLDTFSVGLPTVLLGWIFSKKTLIRIGGDFLWETYIQSGTNIMSLVDFYRNMPKLSIKESVILSIQKFIFSKCSGIVFTSEWQRDIFIDYYGLDKNKTFFVDNFFPSKIASSEPKKNIFLYAGRSIKLKNIEVLKEIFKELPKDIILETVDSLSHEVLIERMKDVYAVILPSFTDVTPNFIIDAISLNKPFILTKECGYYNRFKDLGLFVDPFDREDIKNKIILMTNRETYLKYRKKIENFTYTHSWSDIVKKYIDIYKKI